MSQAAAPATASAPGASLLPDTTEIFTIGHLALIALLAVLVIAGLIWGVRNARARRESVREVKAHNREIGQGGEGGAALERRSGIDRRSADAGDQPVGPTISPDVANEPTELLFEKLPDARSRYVTTRKPMPKPAPRPAEPIVAADAVKEVPPAADPEPAREAAAITAPPPVESGPPPGEGPVTQLKGLGPKLAAKLGEHGIVTVGDLAALTDDQAAALDARLGPFTGRMARDRWQEQARFLAAGDRAGFEAVFGRL